MTTNFAFPRVGLVIVAPAQFRTSARTDNGGARQTGRRHSCGELEQARQLYAYRMESSWNLAGVGLPLMVMDLDSQAMSSRDSTVRRTRN